MGKNIDLILKMKSKQGLVSGVLSHSFFYNKKSPKEKTSSGDFLGA
jgi:hypothetical protein